MSWSNFRWMSVGERLEFKYRIIWSKIHNLSTVITYLCFRRYFIPFQSLPGLTWLVNLSFLIYRIAHYYQPLGVVMKDNLAQCLLCRKHSYIVSTITAVTFEMKQKGHGKQCALVATGLFHTCGNCATEVLVSSIFSDSWNVRVGCIYRFSSQ